jgi:hypothetical protein
MWKLNEGERLAYWRSFRKNLDELDLEQALKKISDFWQSAPFSPYYLDPRDSRSWPDPWTLISENYYCDIAKSLGMLYTALLTDHGLHGEIRIYYDTEQKLNYNLAWIDDGKYVLNMVDGEVLNNKHIPKTFELKYRHDVSGLFE